MATSMSGTPLRYVVLTWYPEEGWHIDEETDDQATAIGSLRWYQDKNIAVRVFDTQGEV